MYKNRFQGFTLIELLVVIAIIGILSAVVLASLNTARTKGSDAAEASNMSTIQTQAEIYYGGTGSGNTNRYNNNGATGVASGECVYTANTLFADANIKSAILSAISANGGLASAVSLCALNSDGTSYAVSIKSKVTPANYFCVDSSGYVSPSAGGALSAKGGGASIAASCQ